MDAEKEARIRDEVVAKMRAEMETQVRKIHEAERLKLQEAKKKDEEHRKKRELMSQIKEELAKIKSLAASPAVPRDATKKAEAGRTSERIPSSPGFGDNDDLELQVAADKPAPIKRSEAKRLAALKAAAEEEKRRLEEKQKKAIEEEVKRLLAEEEEHKRQLEDQARKAMFEEERRLNEEIRRRRAKEEEEERQRRLQVEEQKSKELEEVKKLMMEEKLSRLKSKMVPGGSTQEARSSEGRQGSQNATVTERLRLRKANPVGQKFEALANFFKAESEVAKKTMEGRRNLSRNIKKSFGKSTQKAPDSLGNHNNIYALQRKPQVEAMASPPKEPDKSRSMQNYLLSHVLYDGREGVSSQPKSRQDKQIPGADETVSFDAQPSIAEEASFRDFRQEVEKYLALLEGEEARRDNQVPICSSSKNRTRTLVSIKDVKQRFEDQNNCASNGEHHQGRKLSKDVGKLDPELQKLVCQSVEQQMWHQGKLNETGKDNDIKRIGKLSEEMKVIFRNVFGEKPQDQVGPRGGQNCPAVINKDGFKNTMKTFEMLEREVQEGSKRDQPRYSKSSGVKRWTPKAAVKAPFAHETNPNQRSNKTQDSHANNGPSSSEAIDKMAEGYEEPEAEQPPCSYSKAELAEFESFKQEVERYLSLLEEGESRSKEELPAQSRSGNRLRRLANIGKMKQQLEDQFRSQTDPNPTEVSNRQRTVGKLSQGDKRVSALLRDTSDISGRQQVGSAAPAVVIIDKEAFDRTMKTFESKNTVEQKKPLLHSRQSSTKSKLQGVFQVDRNSSSGLATNAKQGGPTKLEGQPKIREHLVKAKEKLLAHSSIVCKGPALNPGALPGGSLPPSHRGTPPSKGSSDPRGPQTLITGSNKGVSSGWGAILDPEERRRAILAKHGFKPHEDVRSDRHRRNLKDEDTIPSHILKDDVLYQRYLQDHVFDDIEDTAGRPSGADLREPDPKPATNAFSSLMNIFHTLEKMRRYKSESQVAQESKDCPAGSLQLDAGKGHNSWVSRAREAYETSPGSSAAFPETRMKRASSLMEVGHAERSVPCGRPFSRRFLDTAGRGLSSEGDHREDWRMSVGESTRLSRSNLDLDEETLNEVKEARRAAKAVFEQTAPKCRFGGARGANNGVGSHHLVRRESWGGACTSSSATKFLDLDEETLQEVKQAKSAARAMFERAAPKYRFGGSKETLDQQGLGLQQGGSLQRMFSRTNSMCELSMSEAQTLEVDPNTLREVKAANRSARALFESAAPKYKFGGSQHNLDRPVNKVTSASGQGGQGRDWLVKTVNKYFDVIVEEKDDDDCEGLEDPDDSADSCCSDYPDEDEAEEASGGGGGRAPPSGTTTFKSSSRIRSLLSLAASRAMSAASSTHNTGGLLKAVKHKLGNSMEMLSKGLATN